MRAAAEPLQTMVFVVDDDPAMREALDSLIRSNGLGVQTFGSALEFLRHKRPELPSCLVLDVRLPDLSGLDLQFKLVASSKDLPIIFITGHGDIPASVRAMKTGAVEFFTKPFDPIALLGVIREAIECDRVGRQERDELAELKRKFRLLTEREEEVFRLVVKGYLNKQIAAELGRAEGTVKVQRSRLMKKMKAASLAELVRMSEKLSRLTSRDFCCVRNSCKPKSI